ncbi:hypothetical protein [Chitinophaga lutea]|uniref:hypothetical protein n=1 Tax=Chitinophaga lutea TaxID=2488634 RepID=UPI0015F2D793|nr:hypothetical protein [Chitinophaga lutea]
MKRFLILVSLIAVAAAFKPAAAQVRVSVNIGMQPAWGPSGYDYAEYYYLPEMDMYYYIPAREYIYFHRGRWVRTRYVPVHYRHYDFYRTYKVVINDRDPFRYHDRYRTRYAAYRYRYDQPVLRDVRDNRRDHNGWNNHGAPRRENNGWNNDRRDNDRWDNNRGNDRRDNDRWDNNRGNDRRDNDRWDNNRGNDRRGNEGWNNNRGNGGKDKGNKGRGNDNKGGHGNRGNGKA